MSGKACEPKFSKQNRILKTAEMKKGFTDADLMKLVESGEKGLIMAWSPHMPLSAEAIKEARAAAKALGMKFTLVLDPHADSSFAEKFRQENRMNTSAMRKIQSIDLIYRGIPNHYPVVVPYSDGKLSVNLIPGHSLKDRYVTLIKQSLQ
jgi:hypothetical protein